MIKYIFYFLIAIIVGFLPAEAQKETYNWYFGYTAAITFMPDGRDPQALIDANILFSQQEGVATISDRNGRLLFYTDGLSVWNGNHFFMPNGDSLMGNPSSTQSAIIVPQPGFTDKYYIFTVPSIGNWEGLRYSVIDMSLDGGKGDVVQNQKNIYLYGPVCEKITAVRHANGKDVWVISHAWNSNAFRSYLLTKNGIEDYVISTVGSIHTGSTYNTIGYMKTTVDGKKLGLTISSSAKIELFDFDNSTGKLDHRITIDKFGEMTNTYGLEFSPDGAFLYVSEAFFEYGNMYQFNLNAGSIQNIRTSNVLIGSGKNFGALQLGPDGKIYVAMEDSEYLGVINDPGKRGEDCGFVDTAVYLKRRRSGLGLPNFLPALIFNVSIKGANKLCEGSTLTLEPITPPMSGNIRYKWYTPEGWTILTKILTLDSVTVSMNGYFKVEVNDGTNIYTDSILVEVLPRPSFSILPSREIYICKGAKVQLSSSLKSSKYEYKWSNGSDATSINVYNEGIYYLVVTGDNGCSSIDSAIVHFYPENMDKIAPTGRLLICEGDSIILSVRRKEGYTYRWSTGDTLPEITVRKAGMYFILSTSGDGCRAEDTAYVDVVPQPKAAIMPDGPASVCDGDSVVLKALPEGNYLYSWSTGETSPSIVIKSKPGTQQVSVIVKTSSGCFDTSSIDVTVFQNPVVELNTGKNVEICTGDTLMVTPGEFVSYKWSTGETTRSILITNAGYYSVDIVDSNGCTGSAGVMVTQIPFVLDLPDNLVFKTYVSASEAEKTISLSNENDEKMIIESIRIINEPSDYIVSTSKSLPTEIVPGETFRIDLKVLNTRSDDYSDILEVGTLYPCNKKFNIPLSIENSGSVVSLPGTIETIGKEGVEIPLTAYFKESVNTTLSYQAVVSFDASLFLPDDNQGFLLNEIKDGIRYIKLAGSDINLTNQSAIIGRIKGTILLPKSDSLPVKLAEFFWDNPFIPIDTIHGSIKVTGLCQQSASRIQIYEKASLKSMPNPANEATDLIISGSFRGTGVIDLIDTRGVKVASWNFNKTDEIEMLTLSFSNISDGIYVFVCRSEAGIITEQIAVIR